MIDTLVHKYKIKNLSKSVAFFKIKKAITSLNLDEFMEELKELKNQKHDCYIAVLNNDKLLSALTIKVLLMFQKTLPEKTGILITPNLKTNIIISKLNKHMIIDETPKTVLIKIEKNKLRVNHNE